MNYGKWDGEEEGDSCGKTVHHHHTETKTEYVRTRERLNLKAGDRVYAGFCTYLYKCKDGEYYTSGPINEFGIVESIEVYSNGQHTFSVPVINFDTKGVHKLETDYGVELVRNDPKLIARIEALEKRLGI